MMNILYLYLVRFTLLNKQNTKKREGVGERKNGPKREWPL